VTSGNPILQKMDYFLVRFIGRPTEPALSAADQTFPFYGETPVSNAAVNGGTPDLGAQLQIFLLTKEATYERRRHNFLPAALQARKSLL
jgi:hypothetical protein